MQKYIIAILAFSLISVFKINAQQAHDHGDELPTIKFSQIVDGIEIFAEYPALVQGQDAKFIVHFTNLVNYKPISDADVELKYGGVSVDKADKVLRDGIFILYFKPKSKGFRDLEATLHYAGRSFTFKFDEPQVYGDVHDAIHDAAEHVEPEIVFLKEQAWIGKFGIQQVKLSSFDDIIHTSGEILPAVDNRITIVAKNSGVVKLQKNSIRGKQLSKGQLIGSISGKNLENSSEVVYQKALASYNDVESRYAIASKLVKKQSISRKEYSRVKAEYQRARAQLTVFGDFDKLGNFMAQNQNGLGMTIRIPRDGYISNIMVTNGQYVNSGDGVAEITVGNSYLLKVDFPKHEMGKMKYVVDANFVPEYLDQSEILTVSALGGVPLHGNKLGAGRSPYIPYYFNLPDNDQIVPNSFASVAVKCNNSNRESSIVIPMSSLMENEGNYWIYVELDGENYTHREIRIGDNNGKEVVVLEGLKEGEVVVTNGAYRIKQAESSGEIPEHMH